MVSLLAFLAGVLLGRLTRWLCLPVREDDLGALPLTAERRAVLLDHSERLR